MHTEEKFRNVLERISDAFVALDANWCYTYMNKKAGEIFHRNPEEMIGKHIWTEFPEAIGQPFYIAYHKAMQEQKYIKREDYYPPYNKWFENHIYPSPDGLTIYFSDITERKQEQKEMVVVQKRLQKAQELGKLGYWELESNSDMIWGSEKTLEIFGFPSTEGKIPVDKIESLIPEIEKVKKAAEELIKFGKKYELELLIHPSNGSSERNIAAIAEVEVGPPAKIIGVIKDITEEKKSAQILLDSFRNTNNILESISDGFFTVDNNLYIKYWNKEAERCLGRNRENVKNKNLCEILSENAVSIIISELSEAINRQTTVHFEDYYHPTKLWLKFNAYPTPEGASIFFQDVTEVKRQAKLDVLEREAIELYTNKNNTVEEIITFLLNGLRSIHPDMLCSVLKVKNGKLYNWSSPHLPKEYNEKVEGTVIAVGNGSCGSAAFLRKKIEADDILTDPYWKDYRDIIKNFEMKACWSYPIIDSKQNLLGTFAIYHNTIRILTHPEEMSIDRVRNILVHVIEKKLAEEETKISKEQLELVFNTSQDMFFLIAVENYNTFRFVMVNQPFLTSSNMTRDQVEGKLVEEVVPEPYRSNVLEKYREAIDTKEVVTWNDIAEYHSGQRIGIVTISPVLNENRECINIVGAVHDITEVTKNQERIRKANEELKNSNQQLKEKNEMLEAIAWVQSHKVRAPVARIMGLANLLINHDPHKTDHDMLIQLLWNSSKELDEVIKEIVAKSAENV